MHFDTFSHPELVKNLSPEVKKIFSIFGDEIRLVGGSVRDLLLGREVSDFDFATTFLPDAVTKILEKNKINAVPTGVKFGTITAVINNKNYEITTLRKDRDCGGRSCEVEFVDDYFFDASRRDFTINALYLDSSGLVYDYFGGISDLEEQKVKFIGEALKRIEEDFLRILRFFRFSCDYARDLDCEGLNACILQKRNLKKLSRERIRQEFFKLISSQKKNRLISILKTLQSEGIAAEIFSSKLDISALKRLGEADYKLKIAALFLDKQIDSKIFFREICATNLEKKYFQFLLTTSSNLDLSSIKQLLAFHDKKLILDFYLLNSAKKQLVAQNNLQFIREFSLPKFPLDGKDVIAIGLSGRALGEAIKQAKKFWAENNFNPTKKVLLNFLKKVRS